MAIAPIQKWLSIAVTHIQPVKHLPHWWLQSWPQRKVIHRIKDALIPLHRLCQKGVAFFIAGLMTLDDAIDDALHLGHADKFCGGTVGHKADEL